jgi:hypothetical protein
MVIPVEGTPALAAPHGCVDAQPAKTATEAAQGRCERLFVFIGPAIGLLRMIVNKNYCLIKKQCWLLDD